MRFECDLTSVIIYRLLLINFQVNWVLLIIHSNSLNMNMLFLGRDSMEEFRFVGIEMKNHHWLWSGIHFVQLYLTWHFVTILCCITPRYVYIQFIYDLNKPKQTNLLTTWLTLGQTKKYVCLRSPDRPYFSAADPNLFYRQLFDSNFC